MAENTNIEWCDATFNGWIGCTKISPACDHCYAEVSTPARTMKVVWGPHAERHRTTRDNWRMPKHWNDQHDEFFAKYGRRRRVFCASLADWADNEVPIEWLADLLELVRTTPNLDWLMLTKRIGNVMKRLRAVLEYITLKSDEALAALQSWIKRWIDGEPPSNVWLGATITSQDEADRDIPKLLMTPARVRFLSMEPLLGPVDLQQWVDPIGMCCGQEMQSCEDCPADAEWIHGPTTEYADDGSGYSLPEIGWVIVGGESGPHARPMHPDWAPSLRDQCEAAGVPFLMKQWGEWMPAKREGNTVTLRFANADATGPNQPEWFEWPDGQISAKVGKKAAGRLLDGVQHDGFPEAP